MFRRDAAPPLDVNSESEVLSRSFPPRRYGRNPTRKEGLQSTPDIQVPESWTYWWWCRGEYQDTGTVTSIDRSFPFVRATGTVFQDPPPPDFGSTRTRHRVRPVHTLPSDLMYQSTSGVVEGGN